MILKNAVEQSLLISISHKEHKKVYFYLLYTPFLLYGYSPNW